MSGLVRDVYELVDPDDLKISKELAIKNYNEIIEVQGGWFVEKMEG